MGLPKDLRLRQRRDFDNVFKGARAFNDNFLVLRAVPNNLDHNRYGFVTSKRIGGAVVRNRVRRRLREIVRHAPAKAGYDVVLSAKTTAPNAEFGDLRLAVTRLLDRAGLGVLRDDSGQSARQTPHPAPSEAGKPRLRGVGESETGDAQDERDEGAAKA